MLRARKSAVAAASEATSGDGDVAAATWPSKLAPGPGLPPNEVAAHQLRRIRQAAIELVAAEGCAELKVRELVKRAGVSTRAFYSHFESKEDCFLHTYEFVVRRSARRIIASQRGEGDWRRRLHLLYRAFAQELESDSVVARFALVEIYAGGSKALASARRTECLLGDMLVESLGRPPGGASVPPLVARGMVAGIAQIGRGRLESGRLTTLRELTEEMTEWLTSYVDGASMQLAELDEKTIWRNTVLEPNGPVSTPSRYTATGDRALIIDAITRLTVMMGCGHLTPARIRTSAGVSRGKFELHFKGVEDCYLAALEHHSIEAMAQASRAQAAAASWEGGVYRSIAAFCEWVARDPFLADACMANRFPQDPAVTRLRRRLGPALVEQLCAAAPIASWSDDPAAEASIGAVWAVFLGHLMGEGLRSREIAATLAYLALVPSIGAEGAIAAIRGEQSAEPSRVGGR